MIEVDFLWVGAEAGESFYLAGGQTRTASGLHQVASEMPAPCCCVDLDTGWSASRATLTGTPS